MPVLSHEILYFNTIKHYKHYKTLHSFNFLVLYDSSYWETAAKQICRLPKGMSLTSLPAAR
jgi:hypothetical protein